jgi:AAA+ ATPase superfamily predicted ATPase
MIGRKEEQEELQQIIESNQSEFVAVFGRRRVGKTLFRAF